MNCYTYSGVRTTSRVNIFSGLMVNRHAHLFDYNFKKGCKFINTPSHSNAFNTSNASSAKF